MTRFVLTPTRHVACPWGRSLAMRRSQWQLADASIVGGKGGTVRRSDVELAPGLGYWAESTVDTHFDREGRVHRLMTVFAQNPDALGIGM